REWVRGSASYRKTCGQLSCRKTLRSSRRCSRFLLRKFVMLCNGAVLSKLPLGIRTKAVSGECCKTGAEIAPVDEEPWESLLCAVWRRPLASDKAPILSL